MRKPLEKNPETTSCVFFVEDANACAIRFSRPISCRTFPLEFDGQKFYVTDRSCSGIGKGEVTKEALKEVRDISEQEYKERIDTRTALPGVYTIIISQLMQQSSEAMKDLSDDDRKKMETIMAQKDSDEQPKDDTVED